MFFSIQESTSYLEFSFSAPRSANALSLKAARELQSLTKKYKKWSKPVIVSSGHPRVFCSGGNLTDYAKLKTKPEGLKINREIAACLDAFAAWPVIKIAWVNGDVLGGGMEWLARFDFRWSTPEAVFAFWQRRIGLSTGWGGGAWWAGKIGEENVRRLLIRAEPITATGALRIGLVDRILPQWRAQPELEKFVSDLAGESVSAARRWKIQSEAKVFASLWMASEHRAVLKRWGSKL